MSLTDSMAGFLPELALAATVVGVLAADLLLASHPARFRVLALIGILGLATSAAGCVHLPAGDATLFDGMISLDRFAIFFKWLFLGAALLGVLFGMLSEEVPRARFGEYLLLLFCLTLGMNLLASARNLLMIYLSIELVSLPSYVLAGFRRGDRRSSEAALKYVIYGGAASALMLWGFSMLYGLAGTLDLARIGSAVSRIAGQGPTWHLAVVMSVLLALVGFGYKVAAVPFHAWCPDVYEGAPTPFTAFLSVGPKAAGVAALLRFLLVGFAPPGADPSAWIRFPWPVILGVVAMATMTLGNLVAIAQDNLKRLLAYSSIAHAGYVLMAVAAGTEEGSRAAMLYLPIYLLMNMGAFLAVMAVRSATGSESISGYRGLGTRSPYLAVTLAIFLFSLTGLPPFAGFIGKFYLFAAVVRSDMPFMWVVAIVGAANSAVSLYFYARVVGAMFLEKADGEASVLAVGFPRAALLAALAVPTVLLGIWWAPLADAVRAASSMRLLP